MQALLSPTTASTSSRGINNNTRGRSNVHAAVLAPRHKRKLSPSCRGQAVTNSNSNDNNSSIHSIDYYQQRQQLQHVQQTLQQQRRRQQDDLLDRELVLSRQQPPSRSGEETDLLWAGYSALEEQLAKAHKRHEALATQLESVQAKLHAVQSQQQQQQPFAASAWQAASFLLFFLCFINCWGWIANMQMGWTLPWVAVAKPAAGQLFLRQLLGVAVPLTNTVVVIIFCMQAVRAAWTCLKWQ